MNLHIIHKSASQHASAKNALSMITALDTVIFIDDGIYNTLNNTDIAKRFIQTKATLLLIEEHAIVRGIAHIHSNVKKIDMLDFVQLSLTAKHNISWY